jgi:hypothetical protein
MQESYDYYQLCQHTSRNKGLYTSDQQINRNDRRGTRQNPNGNRYGYECPEERDYYPWWAPSPWIDIAVLTDLTDDTICYPYSTSCSKRCEYYLKNTMNFQSKGYCDVIHDGSQSVLSKMNSRAWQSNRWYNNKVTCETSGYHWYEISHSDNLQLSNNSFICAKTHFSHIHQVGNAIPSPTMNSPSRKGQGITVVDMKDNINANRFLWTIPEIPIAKDNTNYFLPSMTNAYQSCILRLRYNISSIDYQQWPLDAVDSNTTAMSMVDSKNNSIFTDNLKSPFFQDPYVMIGPSAHISGNMKFVKLKVNSNQYGRTFQDRSYVFSIKPLPLTSSSIDNEADTPQFDSIAIYSALQNGGIIYNVNVRGKRGNNVQVYPSVEYDFVPNALALNVNDLIHFQWTGSDYNPRRGCNDATGNSIHSFIDSFSIADAFSLFFLFLSLSLSLFKVDHLM